MNVCVSVYECECMYECMSVWVRVCVSMNMSPCILELSEQEGKREKMNYTVNFSPRDKVIKESVPEGRGIL